MENPTRAIQEMVERDARVGSACDASGAATLTRGGGWNVGRGHGGREFGRHGERVGKQDDIIVGK